jgi:hypothetical protein
MLSKKWVDLPGFSKATAGAGERILYEFGLAGRELVTNTDIATKEAILRWVARFEMIALCAIIMVLTGIAWKKYGRGRVTEEA